MKKTILVLAAILVFMTMQGYSQKPEVYEGAVPASPDSTDEFLVKDSYEKVRAHYLQQKGKPHNERILEETGQKSIFFIFIDRLPDAAGVHVEEMWGNSQWVNLIFSKLEGCVDRGFLTQEDLEKIKEKHRYLKNYYYLATEEGRMDEVIYKKYRDRISSGGDAKDLATKAQELMMEGKMEEAKKLVEQAKEAAMKSIDLADSPAVVDEWVKCLEEIAAAEEYSFPVHIRYSGF